MPTNVSDLGTILGVWAHPDDEAFLSAGVMAAAAANRQRVVCLTLTSGERGGSEDDLEAVGRRRRQELALALEIAGVGEHTVHDLPDGGCADLDPALGIDLVRSQINHVQPDTILTFGPDGLTGHPDHRATSAWTTAAWEATGRRATLLHAAIPAGFNDRHRAIHQALLPFDPGLPVETSPADLAVRHRLTPVEVELKMAVLAAHRSQTGPIESVIGRDALAGWWVEECFIAAVDALRLAG